jgi:hypothetical protein
MAYLLYYSKRKYPMKFLVFVFFTLVVFIIKHGVKVSFRFMK